MDGVHDMGGMHGFGPIERDELSYHEAWEARVHGISNALAAPGGGRYSLEALDPAEYVGSSYYKRWLLARIHTLVDAGAITETELEAAVEKFQADPDAGMPEDDADGYQKALDEVREARKKAGDSSFPPGAGPDVGQANEPRFKVGDRVTAKTIHPVGHTRLPRYVRGRAGEVISIYRPQGFQDHEPIDGGAPTQPMYAVRFEGQELWGDQAETNSSVVLDMWESYLE
jgi:nitrile hydratase subunit beta